MSVAVLAVGVVVAMAWTALVIRLVGFSRGDAFRHLGPVEAPPDDGPTVEAIVPARDEEARVGETIAAIRAQRYPRLAIVAIDDQSSDRTGSILDALASGGKVPIRVVHGVERPAGWVGKTWAVHQGVLGAGADWLWFVDADMGLHPLALASAMAEADRTGAALVSLMPGLRCETFWQGAIASVLLQVLAHLYPLGRVVDPGRADAIAAGGFLLVRRSAYEEAGGHAAVRAAIVEDIGLARAVKASGGRLAVRLAPALAWTHMYGDFGAIWRGLRKNAYAGMDYLFYKYAFGAVGALLMAWAPVLTLAHGLYRGQGWATAAGAWGILAQALASIPGVLFLGLSPAFALASPAGITAYVAIATSSVWHHHRGRVLWKGRTIPASTVVGANSEKSRDGIGGDVA